MKRKNYNIISLAVMALMTLVFACDDFTEVTPEYSINSEDYFNSEDDYYNALVACYDVLQSTYVNVIVGEIASDNTYCGGESPTDVIGWQQIDDMIHTSVNDNLDDIWDYMFGGVQRCNYFMEFKDKTEFEGRDVMVGEVQFLRAYFHFELVKWFGGIPLKINERFAIGDELTIPRSSVADVYAQIEQDLIDAIGVLPVTAEQQGRVTLGAAQALLGKAYLYQEKFTEAKDVLDELISDGNYSLLTQNFLDLFEHENENCSESVFEVQYTDLEGAGFECLQCSEGNVAVGFSGVRGYKGPKFTSGFSFNVPTAEAASIYQDEDRRKELSILDIAAWQTEEAGVEYTEGNEHTGYFNRKYLPRLRSDEAQQDKNLTNPNNYRAIRYSDVLLMAAEAYNRGNIDDTKAQGYLNQVRRRAFNVTDDSYDITLTGSALTEAIYAERRMELLGEGHRFFDLVRTGQAASKISGFEAGKNELFPIPLEEIEFSNGNWEQNPNY